MITFLDYIVPFVYSVKSWSFCTLCDFEEITLCFYFVYLYLSLVVLRVTQIALRGHSITTWTDFHHFLTTYLPLSDKHGHLVDHLPFVYVDTLKMTTSQLKKKPIHILSTMITKKTGSISSTAVWFLLLKKRSGAN